MPFWHEIYELMMLFWTRVRHGANIRMTFIWRIDAWICLMEKKKISVKISFSFKIYVKVSSGLCRKGINDCHYYHNNIVFKNRLITYLMNGKFLSFKRFALIWTCLRRKDKRVQRLALISVFLNGKKVLFLSLIN